MNTSKLANIIPLAQALHESKHHTTLAGFLVQAIACSVSTESVGNRSIITTFSDGSGLQFVYGEDFTIKTVAVLT